MADANGVSRARWPWIVGVIGLLCLLVILYFMIHAANAPGSFSIKTPLIFLIALVVLAGASYTIIYSERKIEIQYVIAFDILVFVVIGFALVISAATRWQAACFTAGASLLGGGFFGLIFGMPLSVAGAPSASDANDDAAKAAAKAAVAVATANAAGTDEAKRLAVQAQATAQKAAAVSGRIAKHSLLAEAAGTLSKLIAGATLVQIGPIFRVFKQTSAYVSVYLLQDTPANGAAFGGAVLLYFVFLGFLSGLFLPAYFMQDLWDQ
jgi:hypothetical protein